LFIINPIAGGKKGRFVETEREIRAFAGTLSDPYEIYITKAPMDACCKVAEDAGLAERLFVYACGGDGTLNECANGAANRGNVAITCYPSGTGNDFLKTFGLGNIEKFRDLKALSRGFVRPLDIIDCSGRYGINICSVGIDARIGADVHKYSSIPIIGGATGYVVSLIVNVIKGVAQNFRISTGEGFQEGGITLACACNGRFYGGGFNPVPEAIPDDGIIEFLIIKAVSRLKVAQIVGKYAKGRYSEFPHLIKHVSGTCMEIEGDREFVVGMDGEAFLSRSVCFKIVPGGVNFIFPVGMEYPFGSKNQELRMQNA